MGCNRSRVSLVSISCPAHFADTRVLLVGAFDDALHAHAGLRRRALERLGCRVSHRQPDRDRRLAQPAPPGRPARPARPRDRRHGAGARARARGQPGGRRRWSPRSGRAAAPRGSTGSATRRRSAEDVLPLAAAYDAVFVADRATAAALDAPGNPPVHYLPAGCDPSIHRPMRARDRFRANVVFVGTATPAPRAAAVRAGGVRPGGLGAGMAADQARDYCRGELLSHEDYIRAYAGRRWRSTWPAPRRAAEVRDPGASRRLFELAAIGVPQVVEDHADIHQHFREGSEILVARSPRELRSLTAEALHDRAWAEQVAAGARQRALTEHTYMHRLAGAAPDGGRTRPAL